MTTTKTTIQVDEEVWSRFKTFVSLSFGSDRALSNAVQEAMRAFDTLGMLNGLLAKLGLGLAPYPSGSEVKARRPIVKTSAGKIVREIRDGRLKRVSGLQ